MMVDNGTDVSAPLVQSSYVSVPYNASAVANSFRSENPLRPSANISFAGSHSYDYIIGLAIVPIALGCVFIVWLVALGFAGCSERRRHRSKSATSHKRSSGKRVVQWIILTLLLIGMLISWIFTFVFAMRAVNDAPQLEQQFGSFAKILSSVNTRMGMLAAGVNQANTALNGATSTCVTGIKLIDTTLLSSLNTVRSTLSQAQTLVSALGPTVKSTQVEMDQFANTSSQVIQIETTVIAAVSGVEVFLAFMTLGLFAAKGLYSKTCQGRCCVRGSACGRCCSPLVALAILNILITLIVGAALHVITLTLADACAPDVNININRLLGEFDSISSFANYQGQNIHDMCANLNPWDAPLAAQALCYYQTCDVSYGFGSSVVLALNDFDNNAKATLATLTPFLKYLTLVAPDATSPCRTSVTSMFDEFSFTLRQVEWILYDVSCQNINSLYSQVVYESVCRQELQSLASTFNAWIAACAFSMAALLFWVIFRGGMLSGRSQPHIEANVPTRMSSSKHDACGQVDDPYVPEAQEIRDSAAFAKLPPSQPNHYSSTSADSFADTRINIC